MFLWVYFYLQVTSSFPLLSIDQTHSSSLTFVGMHCAWFFFLTLGWFSLNALATADIFSFFCSFFFFFLWLFLEWVGFTCTKFFYVMGGLIYWRAENGAAEGRRREDNDSIFCRKRWDHFLKMSFSFRCRRLWDSPLCPFINQGQRSGRKKFLPRMIVKPELSGII